jgi:hypothetical protein
LTIYITRNENVLVNTIFNSNFSLGTLVSSTNKTDHPDKTEILLKVALNTITLTHKTNRRDILTDILLKVALNTKNLNIRLS